MNSLQIGKAIYQLLIEKRIRKVFPLVADEGTTFPFVIYRRTGLRPAGTKDKYNYSELATIDILVASSDYESGVNLANTIKEIENTRGTYNGVNIGDIYLTDATEDYIEDSFI